MKCLIAISLLLATFAQAANVRSNNRIVGGEEAEPHSFPFQAALFIEVPQGTAFCGGSVISEHHILTAAHCVYQASSAKVVLGAHNIREEESTQQAYQTSNFIVHENWFPLGARNDIAIVVVSETFIIDGTTVKTITYANGSDDADLVGKEGTVSGWGKDSDDALAVSPVLRFVKSTIMESDICNIFYLGQIQKDTNICMTGKDGKSSCSGDSGGPLTIATSDSDFKQFGIVSFGIIFGCEVGWPSVYTYVPAFSDWIDEHVKLPIS